MYLYKRDRSPYYWTKFQVGGKTFQLSTNRSVEREAETEARALKKQKQREHDERSGVTVVALTLEASWDKLWDQVTQNVANRDDLDAAMTRVMTQYRDEKGKPILGPDKLITEITHDDVLKLRDWRAKQYRWDRPACGLVSNRTVNQTLEVLRSIFVRAENKWGVTFDPNKRPHFDELMLDVPAERIRVLSVNENNALSEEMGGDYLDVFDFALVSGFRLETCLLRWPQVDLENDMIEVIGKGNKMQRRRLTPGERTIIERHTGEHPEFVFTFVQETTRAVRTANGPVQRIAGQRYPITYEGLKSHYGRARANAVLKAPSLAPGDRAKNFRFHDTRHTFGTTLLNSGANIKVVQRALNHANIATTMKYVHALDDDLAAGMAAAQQAMETKYKSKPERKTGTVTHIRKMG